MAYGPVDKQTPKKEGATPKSKELKFWLNEISRYENDYKPWEERSEKIIKRYRDERDGNRKAVLFNILWSNVQTLHPALYAQAPVPNVDRKFHDDDDLSRTVAQVTERSVSYFTERDSFDQVMKQSVLDRLLPGRGISWVRYCPYFDGEKPQITEDVTVGEPLGDEGGEVVETLSGEDVVIDYVHWRDFGHTFGRTWEEVRAVWRRVYLDRAQLIERFGKKIAMQIPLDACDEQEKKADSGLTKAAIYEIWDKSKKEVVWLSKAMPDILDKKDDPLALMGFFPCPRPLYATITNENLIPTPDYVQYQDQAYELDMLTNRISKIVQALRVSGVYDSTAEGIKSLLTENSENKMIPVQNWAVLGDKGGLKGVVDWFPLEVLADTLRNLYEARERAKQDLYEVTGISDIIRGATNANETATAQQIKGKFATLRLDSMQKEVGRYGRDLVRLMAEIICSHFSLETIKKISGVKLLTAQEKQQAMMMAQQQQQPAAPGQPPAAPPIPVEIQDLMELPTWEEVHAVMQDDLQRSYRVDIETDSTIKVDQDAEKQSRVEFLNAAGQFIGQATQVQDPNMQPLLMELLMFGVRGFKVARDLETQFESTMKKMKKAAENPQPKPDPEAAKLQAEAEMEKQKLAAEQQNKQAELQIKGQEIEANTQIKAAELQIKQRELEIKEKELQLSAADINAKYDIEGKKLDHDKHKTRLDAKARMSEEAAATDPDLSEEGKPTPLAAMLEQQAMMLQQTVGALNQGLQQIAQIQAQGNNAVVQAVNKPKTVLRDKQGRITGVK